MPRARFILALLLTVCFCLAAWLQPSQAAREQATGRSGSVLVLLLGDGRRLFANEFFAKADGYFHRGKYPSIFDLNARHEENHLAEEAAHGGHDADDNDHDEDAPPPAKDWIERMNRRFHPSIHIHLQGGNQREMLPWLRLAADLDPHQIETYTVAAYWLRNHLGKVDEAERFIREGLRANPNDPALLYELGSIFFQNRNDPVRARNVWVVALRRWKEIETPKKDPDKLLLVRILGGLARLEEGQGDPAAAVLYLRELKAVSPNPDVIQRQIDELQPGTSNPHSKN